MQEPGYPRRKRQRWRGFNYRTPGAYGVTVCILGKRCVLGTVRGGRMWVNEAGRMVQETWLELPSTFDCVLLDAMIVMPNHMHAVLRLHPAEGAMLAPRSLGQVIAWFKSRTTLAYVRSAGAHGWPDMRAGLWQRGYYDRYLRDEDEVAHARAYIARNPLRWRSDPENPRRQS